MEGGLTCVILVGGLGTRLRSVLSDIPKPMAPVNGRPFLEYLVEQVRVAGYTDVVLCVGHKAEAIENHFSDGSKYDVRIHYSREKELLGTAGALSVARSLIRSDPFLLMNGDSYCAVNFEALFRQHQTSSAIATIVASEVDNTSRYGTIVLKPEDTQIIEFKEKDGSAGSGYVNAGIYLLNQSVFEQIPVSQYCSIEHDLFPSLIGKGIHAFRQTQPFIDIGTPESFEMAQTILPEILQPGVSR